MRSFIIASGLVAVAVAAPFGKAPFHFGSEFPASTEPAGQQMPPFPTGMPSAVAPSGMAPIGSGFPSGPAPSDGAHMFRGFPGGEFIPVTTSTDGPSPTKAIRDAKFGAMPTGFPMEGGYHRHHHMPHFPFGQAGGAAAPTGAFPAGAAAPSGAAGAGGFGMGGGFGAGGAAAPSGAAGAGGFGMGGGFGAGAAAPSGGMPTITTPLTTEPSMAFHPGALKRDAAVEEPAFTVVPSGVAQPTGKFPFPHHHHHGHFPWFPMGMPSGMAMPSGVAMPTGFPGFPGFPMPSGMPMPTGFPNFPMPSGGFPGTFAGGPQATATVTV